MQTLIPIILHDICRRITDYCPNLRAEAAKQNRFTVFWNSYPLVEVRSYEDTTFVAVFNSWDEPITIHRQRYDIADPQVADNFMIDLTHHCIYHGIL